MKRTTEFSQSTRLAAVALVFICGLFASCAVRLPTSANTPKPAPPLFKWWGDDMSGAVALRINLDEQKATIFRGGEEAGWTMLASGKPGHPSPTGTFSVIEKLERKISNTYGVIMNREGNVVNWDAKAGVTPVPPGCRFVGAEMPWWMRITDGGVGMHAGDIPDPGLPASHGCIRLPRDFAGTLYSYVKIGTRVTITGNGENAIAHRNAQEQGTQPLVSGTTPPSKSIASVASLR